MKVKILVADAMLAAMCAVLGYMAISTESIKFTLETLPILAAALLFGPVDGALVGGAGTFIYQLLKFGIAPTTAMWIAPYVIAGALVGLYARRRDFELSSAQYMRTVVLAELSVTALNTVALYVDGHLYGYYRPELILGALLPRIIIAVVKGVAFGTLLPILIRRIKRFRA